MYPFSIPNVSLKIFKIKPKTTNLWQLKNWKISWATVFYLLILETFLQYLNKDNIYLEFNFEDIFKNVDFYFYLSYAEVFTTLKMNYTFYK